MEIRFTGNPFVDAGIAGMCAAADVNKPEELKKSDIEYAVKRLISYLTSSLAIEPLPKPDNPKKMSAFATSEMSAILPNGPLANPANKPKDKPIKYKKYVNDLLSLLYIDGNTGDNCFICGRNANLVAQKTNFPLVDSIDRRNFHPGLNPGHPICAFCALAIQFLPLSILRTSIGGKFWFIATMDSYIAIEMARNFTLSSMDESISKKERIGFFGNWDMPGYSSSVVNAIIFITGERYKLGMNDTNFPVQAFFFTNDNRSPELDVRNIPNKLFRYFSILRLTSNHFNEFLHELLYKEKIGEITCKRMLLSDHIGKGNVVKQGEGVYKLLGGWIAHRLYMEEVLGLSGEYIKSIENVALRIAESENPQKELKVIETIKSPMPWFLSAIRSGYLSKDELYILIPPNDYYKGKSSLDYIYAATIGIINLKEKGNELERFDGSLTSAEKDNQVIQLVELIGEKLLSSSYDIKQILDKLMISRSISQIRHAWLRVIKSGAISWDDFIKILPPDDNNQVYIIRDYMIAYLCDYLRKHNDINQIQDIEIDYINFKEEE